MCISFIHGTNSSRSANSKCWKGVSNDTHKGWWWVCGSVGISTPAVDPAAVDQSSVSQRAMTLTNDVLFTSPLPFFLSFFLSVFQLQYSNPLAASPPAALFDITDMGSGSILSQHWLVFFVSPLFRLRLATHRLMDRFVIFPYLLALVCVTVTVADPRTLWLIDIYGWRRCNAPSQQLQRREWRTHFPHINQYFFRNTCGCTA